MLVPVTKISQPERLDSILFANLSELRDKREQLDHLINAWIENLADADLHDRLSYYSTNGVHHTKHYGSLISHLFLHQVHHRGQITTLLSQCGVNFGDTDLIEIIN